MLSQKKGWILNVYILAAVFSISIIVHAADITNSDNHTYSESDKSAAREYFKNGVRFLRNDEFDKGAAEFQKSIKLYPTKNGLFNLANCYLAMHKYVETIEVIARLKNSFEKELDDQWNNDIHIFEKKMEEVVSQVNLEVNVDDALVVVDNKEVGSTPLLNPLVLPIGTHKIVISKEDYETVTQDLTVDKGGKDTLSITMSQKVEKVEDVLPVEPSEQETKPAEIKKGKRVWTWVALGIGGAAGIASIITGAKAVSISKDINNSCENNFCPPAAKEDADKAHKLAVTTNVLIGVSAAGIIAGTILFFVEGKKEKRTVSFIPTVTPQGGGFSLAKTF